MAFCFEVFFTFVFLRNIPNREADAAFEFFGLMVANMTLACLMDAMINWILLVIISIIWVVAIFAASWSYFYQNADDAEVKSGGKDLVNRFCDETNALRMTIEELEKMFATRSRG
ncbi:hypothetical protein A2U01_0055174 [Trifolium medium]|uniref:Uncharacterized protein n=1 Tax=Trifolium medium TaxID=97028 RepID=A0A392RDP5_9FABA|nr:hypothetical protein [Trifolium medium]